MKLIPDPPPDVGVTIFGNAIYAVRMSEKINEGHWLTKEEMKEKKSYFPDDTIFIVG